MRRRSSAAIMYAFARPGTVGDVAGRAAPPAPVSPAAGAFLLTLADHDTPVFLAAPRRRGRLAAWLSFHTGAPVVASADAAAFAYVAEPRRTAGPGGLRPRHRDLSRPLDDASCCSATASRRARSDARRPRHRDDATARAARPAGLRRRSGRRTARALPARRRSLPPCGDDARSACRGRRASREGLRCT